MFLIVSLYIILLLASVADVRSYRIPNLLTYPGMLVGLCYHTVTGGWNGFWFSGAGLLLGTGLLFVPYLMGGMGAGDAKLLGTVGAFIGAEKVLVAFLFSALAGGLYSIVMLIIYRRQYQGRVAGMWHAFLNFILTRKLSPAGSAEKPTGPKLCYGLAIAVGTGLYIGLETTGHTIIAL
jgi:prepilin peptidase CpaA